MKNHPGDYNRKVGCDIYLNPWWGLDVAASQELIHTLHEKLGPADYWDQECCPEVLWGPRDFPRHWRPGFVCNLSGTNKQIWSQFWLPWRMKSLMEGNLPYACNVHDKDTRPEDIGYAFRFVECIPLIREGLRTGKFRSFAPMLSQPRDEEE